MNRTLIYHITKEYEGTSIQQFLKEQGYSHHVLVQLKKIPESILRNGVWEYVNCKLHENDILEIRYEEPASSEQIPPVFHPLSIVFEDEDIIVLNKPSDMPVHPSFDNYYNTLANGLCYYYQEQNETFTFRCINRLDRDTTGLLIVAKHAISGCILSAMMTKREIHREYAAIVSGMLPPAGYIDAPIARKDDSVIERCVNFEKGESAKTHFKRLQYKDGYSLASITLDTGRTHQIRVHMNYIGHPLPGDYLYNPDYKKIKRQALHSHRLTFPHPITKEILHFEAPLPEDFHIFL